MSFIKEYTINGKKYVQKGLVLGQIQELLKILSAITNKMSDEQIINIISDSDQGQTIKDQQIKSKQKLNSFGIMSLVGDSITKAMITILCPANTPLYKRDKTDMEEDFYNCDPDTVMEVINDFLLINQDSQIFKKMTRGLGMFQDKPDKPDQNVEKTKEKPGNNK